MKTKSFQKRSPEPENEPTVFATPKQQKERAKKSSSEFYGDSKKKIYMMKQIWIPKYLVSKSIIFIKWFI